MIQRDLITVSETGTRPNRPHLLSRRKSRYRTGRGSPGTMDLMIQAAGRRLME